MKLTTIDIILIPIFLLLATTAFTLLNEVPSNRHQTTDSSNQQDTTRVNALVVDTAIVFYPGASCETCMIGNGRPTAVAVARDILVVENQMNSYSSEGQIRALLARPTRKFFELSGLPIDERRIFLIKD